MVEGGLLQEAMQAVAVAPRAALAPCTRSMRHSSARKRQSPSALEASAGREALHPVPTAPRASPVAHPHLERGCRPAVAMSGPGARISLVDPGPATSLREESLREAAAGMLRRPSALEGMAPIP